MSWQENDTFWFGGHSFASQVLTGLAAVGVTKNISGFLFKSWVFTARPLLLPSVFVDFLNMQVRCLLHSRRLGLTPLRP